MKTTLNGQTAENGFAQNGGEWTATLPSTDASGRFCSPATDNTCREGELENLRPVLEHNVREWVKTSWPFARVGHPGSKSQGRTGTLCHSSEGRYKCSRRRRTLGYIRSLYKGQNISFKLN